MHSNMPVWQFIVGSKALIQDYVYHVRKESLIPWLSLSLMENNEGGGEPVVDFHLISRQDAFALTIK